MQPNDDPTNKKSQRIKDSSTLSGGEKSFSTICLLLALWSAAGCPIRGLDEYDVFMDPVNRKVATNMVGALYITDVAVRSADSLTRSQLIEAGHAANNTQMILISPQQMTAYMNTPGVKVIRVVSCIVDTNAAHLFYGSADIIALRRRPTPSEDRERLRPMQLDESKSRGLDPVECKSGCCCVCLWKLCILLK